MSKKLPLYRILQNQGFGTRKSCQLLIEEGNVSIAGQVITVPKTEFDPIGFEFSVFGESWLYREYVYIALNKPSHYECSRKPSYHPGIHTLLPDQFTWRNVQPVGRLDHDTTGLLLLSDHGAFIHAQSHPKYHQPKVYVATLAEAADPSLVEALLRGVKLHDEPLPIAAQMARLLDPTHLEIIIDQGKYHQVKRMLAAAGNHCAALTRAQIGGLTLAALDLVEGEWCYLDEAQLGLLNGEKPGP